MNKIIAVSVYTVAYICDIRAPCYSYVSFSYVVEPRKFSLRIRKLLTEFDLLKVGEHSDANQFHENTYVNKPYRN